MLTGLYGGRGARGVACVATVNRAGVAPCRPRVRLTPASLTRLQAASPWLPAPGPPLYKSSLVSMFIFQSYIHYNIYDCLQMSYIPHRPHIVLRQHPVERVQERLIFPRIPPYRGIVI